MFQPAEHVSVGSCALVFFPEAIELAYALPPRTPEAFGHDRHFKICKPSFRKFAQKVAPQITMDLYPYF
jgi:hypothetical protein